MKQEDVTAFIVQTIQSNPTVQSPEQVSSESRLVGEEAILDSAGLLELLLELEELAEDKLDAAFEWENDSAFSAKRSVFRTPTALSEFFISQISQAQTLDR